MADFGTSKIYGDLTVTRNVNIKKNLSIDGSIVVGGGTSSGYDITIDGYFISASLDTNTALITDANKKIISSSISSTKLGYLTDVTSNIQAQLNGKAASSHTHATLTNGTGLSGNNYNGGTAQEWSVAYGTTSTTACVGNDARLSDARTPTSHTLVSHTASSLTTGHFLKATGATTFGFAAHGLSASDVSALASNHAASGVTTNKITNWDNAHTHISNNGSDHSFINQNVTSTGNPTFGSLTLNGAITSTPGNSVPLFDFVGKNGSGQVTNNIKFGSAQGLGISGATDQYEVGFLITTTANPRNFFLKSSGGVMNLITDRVNNLTLTALASSFTIAGGTNTSRTLTVTADATIDHSTHASGSDNQTITSGNGMNFTTGSGNVTITLGTPGGLTASTTDVVSTSSHTHSIATASAVGLSDSSTNTTGDSTSLARANHTHAISGFALSSHNHSATHINADRLSLARLPTSATANRFLKVGTANSDPTYTTVSKSDVGLSVVENTALSTWAGSANITTVGNLSSGTVPWARLTDIPDLGGQTTVRRQQFIATSNQKIFGLSLNTVPTSDINRVNVYVWGIKQPNSAYSIKSFNEIELTSGVSSGTRVLIEWFESVGDVANIEVVSHASTHNPGGSDPVGDTSAMPNTIVVRDASGDINANKVYNAVWNDLAEFMDCHDKSVEPGDVLIQLKEGLSKSFNYQDKRTVGVYSDTFGLALGGDKENHEGKVPVGISGKVKVKIKEPVEIGDLLVSSDNGFATKMKEYIPGTVIGKVIEEKNNNEVSRIWMLIMNS